MSLSRFSPCTLVVLIAACGSVSAQSFNDAPPNAEGQTPAFANQTRAPVIDSEVTLQREVIAEGLEHPWGMDQLPDGSWIVTERPGRMRIVAPDGTLSDPVSGLPEVDARDQGGLLDVIVAGDFDQTRRVWWSFAQPRGDGANATAVATGTLAADNSAMTDVQVIFQQQPAWQSTKHFGSRLVFDRQGKLFVTTGERSAPQPRQLAQDLDTHLGKVLRIEPMGGPAAGNPDISGALAEIWSYGHRNLQSAALGPDGALWTVEHGPRGGDELNRPQPGLNYGWPEVTYGVDYSGAIMGEGITKRDDVEQPIYYWDPVIAPSGLVFYDGAMFPEWQGDALIGGLADKSLVRLTIDGGQVSGEARYLQGEGRVRDVDVSAQDGAVMILIDAADGALVRLSREG